MLNNATVRKYLSEFDFIYICETHSFKQTKLYLPGYTTIHNPCRLSRHSDDPRGGCVMFVKLELTKFISGSDISFNDAITVYLSNGYRIFGIYIVIILMITLIISKLSVIVQTRPILVLLYVAI